jgi:hypothetical protein
MSALLAFIVAGKVQQSVWLSDLDLTKAQQGYGKPAFNRSVDSNPLKLHGHLYTHGFGTHSPGRLLIRLNEKALTFHAVVGIDDEVPQLKGSAEFLVVGSGRRILWRSGVLRSGDYPKTVDVSIKGQKQLELDVTDGGDDFVYDHADWADAQIAYQGNPPYAVEAAQTDPEISAGSYSPKPQIHGPEAFGVRPETALVWKVPVEGQRPFQFSTCHLPSGLSLDPNSGILSGSIAKPGHYSILVTAENRYGKASKVFDLVVGDRLSLAPPMGWNSFDAFGDSVIESEVLRNAVLLSRRLQPFGWDTIVVDYRWYKPRVVEGIPATNATLSMDGAGRLLPAPDRFPSSSGGHGFLPMAKQLHDMGLKFGIQIMRGIPRQAVALKSPIEGTNFTADQAANVDDVSTWCPDMVGVRANTAAGQAYYDSLLRLYAKWGVDFVKMADASSPYHADEIEAVHRAISVCGRSIVLSVSPGETPLAYADHVAQNANLWRVSDDLWDTWPAIDQEFKLAEKWQRWVGKGHWPDPDMLPLGKLSVGNRSAGIERESRLSHAEQVTLMSFWCLLPAPLMLGGDLVRSSSWAYSLAANPEVLAVDQDPVSHGAHLAWRGNGVDVWIRRLSDESIVVGLFNRTSFDIRQPLTWKAFGLPVPSEIRDLWRRARWHSKEVIIPSHGAALFRVSH